MEAARCDAVLAEAVSKFRTQQRVFSSTKAAMSRLNALRASVSRWQFEGSVTNNIWQQRFYQQLVVNLNISTVCETGFNVGHSAALWLTSGAKRVIAFDLPKPYANTTLQFVRTLGEVTYIPGDSTKTLPEVQQQYANTCDLVSIDGGHFFKVAYADFHHFYPMASGCKWWVIDDTFCSPGFCNGPMKSVRLLHKQGVIKVGGGISFADLGFAYGRYERAPRHLPIID